MQEYDFEIEYFPERDNVVANALSRRAYASTISVVRGQLGTLVKEALPSDPYFGKTYKMLNGVLSKEILSNYDKYRLDDGVLFYEGILCIPDVREIQESILRDCHEIPIAGHQRFSKTYRQVSKTNCIS